MLSIYFCKPSGNALKATDLFGSEDKLFDNNPGTLLKKTFSGIIAEIEESERLHAGTKTHNICHWGLIPRSLHQQ